MCDRRMWLEITMKLPQRHGTISASFHPYIYFWGLAKCTLLSCRNKFYPNIFKMERLLCCEKVYFIDPVLLCWKWKNLGFVRREGNVCFSKKLLSFSQNKEKNLELSKNDLKSFVIIGFFFCHSPKGETINLII